METHIIQYKKSFIHYYRFGTGAKLLIAFHGYGITGESFHVLEEHLESDYTIIAIDFPFHGYTVWDEGLLFDDVDLMNIIETITGGLNQPVSLLGYSMGGRVALHLTELMPDKIEQVVLLAPDGLHTNFWYWLATQSTMGNKLFYFTMKHPGWFISLLNVSYKLGIVNKVAYNFSSSFLREEEERLLLYNRWTTMRKMRVHKHVLKHVLKQKAIPIKLLFGKNDKIILTKDGYHFKKKMDKRIEVIEIDADHHLLRERYLKDIASLFYR